MFCSSIRHLQFMIVILLKIIKKMQNNIKFKINQCLKSTPKRWQKQTGKY